MKIKVGCCGFPISMKDYFSKFKLVEVQKTFYEPPRPETAAKWRSKAPEDFEFSVKAWQVLTHPPSSPTWRRMKTIIHEKGECGFLKPSRENFKAWERTLEICKALKSKVCVVQTPPSFKCTKENVNNMEKFFGSVETGGIKVAWEPRGDWLQRLKEVRSVCEKFGLIHVVDPLRRRPAALGETQYFRLHGLHPRREINYNYSYSKEDLERLRVEVEAVEKEGAKEVYVLFNNLDMAKNAEAFVKMLQAAP